MHWIFSSIFLSGYYGRVFSSGACLGCLSSELHVIRMIWNVSVTHSERQIGVVM